MCNIAFVSIASKFETTKASDNYPAITTKLKYRGAQMVAQTMA